MIASTANPPQTTQAQGGNPLVPFLGAGQMNVGGNNILANTPTDPTLSGVGANGITGIGGNTGPFNVPQGAALSGSVPGAPGDQGAASAGGGGYGTGGTLESPFTPYSPIGNPLFRDPRKKLPAFSPVGGSSQAPQGMLMGGGSPLA